MYTVILTMAIGSADAPSNPAPACQAQACTGYAACHSRFGHSCHHCHGRLARWRHHHCHSSCAVPVTVAPPQEPKKSESLPEPKGKGKVSAASSISAQIVVNVPADARLFIDDQPTTSVGGHRTFVTPNLSTEESYNYTVRVEVTRQGRILRDSRTVQIQGGQITSISFFELGQTAALRTGSAE